MLNSISVRSIQEVLLPLTEFRKNLSAIVDQLTSVKVLMKNDKPKAVLIPYDMYVSMEEELEIYHDMQLHEIAKERLNDNSKYLSSSEMRELILSQED
jgi:PHD/YefM family antitoxin component YafN of YafNO toxin-antitoxin module